MSCAPPGITELSRIRLQSATPGEGVGVVERVELGAGSTDHRRDVQASGGVREPVIVAADEMSVWWRGVGLIVG
jgi:hypothetical protein